MAYVLQTFGLAKQYKGNQVLCDVTMNIERGDIYGFVGENGSGKTTVIRLITGLIHANGGSLSLFGVSSDSPEIGNARKRVGAVVESPSIYLNMSAKENLAMQSGILGLHDEEKCKRVLCEVGLGHLYEDKKHAGNYSLGMRQRLGIAMALLGDPEFLMLDEPMNGLDPAGIVEIRELILRLNREKGITFLISSHILTELALVATKYGIISHGRIMKEITAEELHAERRSFTEIVAKDRDALIALLSKYITNGDMVPTANGVKIYGALRMNLLLKTVIDAGVEILSVNCSQMSIEDYYLSLVGGAHHG